MKIIAPIVAQFEKFCSRIPWVVNLYTSLYKQVLDREISIAQITSSDTVLNVGCGSIPFSAVHIARKTGAQVHAVDIDQDAVIHAQQCIRKLGLSKQISCKHVSGEHISCDIYSVALVALQAQPKKAILKNLMNNAAPGARIIFRRPQPRLLHQYEPLPEEAAVKEEILQHMKTFISSALYIRSA